MGCIKRTQALILLVRHERPHNKQFENDMKISLTVPDGYSEVLAELSDRIRSA